jgi:RNA polymerase sigma-70 factor (ECF subfamily)
MELTPQQFEAMCLEELDGLYRLARRLTRDPDRAEDLVQETLLRAFGARDSFRLQEAGYGVRPWLLRIMHNLHFTRSAREKRQPVSLQGDAPEALARGPDVPLASGPSPADDERDAPPPSDGAAAGASADIASALAAMNRDGMDQQLVRALNNLSDEYQVVLLLWAVEELTYKEIAGVLDVPIGTVMSRLHRARQRLSRDLAEFAAREGVLRGGGGKPSKQEIGTGGGE